MRKVEGVVAAGRKARGWSTSISIVFSSPSSTTRRTHPHSYYYGHRLPTKLQFDAGMQRLGKCLHMRMRSIFDLAATSRARVGRPWLV